MRMIGKTIYLLKCIEGEGAHSRVVKHICLQAFMPLGSNLVVSNLSGGNSGVEEINDETDKNQS